MFSCEETWDIYLTFGRVKKHVRTFKVRAVDPDRLCEPAGTLWLRLPRNAMSSCYELEGLANVDPKEDGLDRGFDISFENPEGRVLVSFETQEDTLKVPLQSIFDTVCLTNHGKRILVNIVSQLYSICR